jgi:hypothetical protein
LIRQSGKGRGTVLYLAEGQPKLAMNWNSLCRNSLPNRPYPIGSLDFVKEWQLRFSVASPAAGSKTPRHAHAKILGALTQSRSPSAFDRGEGILGTERLEIFSLFPPHPNPPPPGGRETQGSLPPGGGGCLVSPSPLVGEGALFLPPPWWGRVGVGGMVLPPPWWGRVGVGGGKGKNVTSPRAQYTFSNHADRSLPLVSILLSPCRCASLSLPRPPLYLGRDRGIMCR